MRPFESDGRYYVEIAKAKVQTPVEEVPVTNESVSTPVGEPPLAVSTVSPADPPIASKAVSPSEAAAPVNVVPAAPIHEARPGFAVYPPALRRFF
jgi:hypothetical protein